MAAMLAIAMTFPYAVGRARAGGANIAARIILVPVLLGGTYFLISQAQSFLYSNLNSRQFDRRLSGSGHYYQE